MTALPADIAAPLRRATRWSAGEAVFWLIPITAYWVFPENLILLSQIAVAALFCLSLDLILGYAGIISLGHAAFFGVGAYAAGLFSKHVMGDPLAGLAVAAVIAGLLGFATSFLVLRGADLTRLMVTLGVAMMLYEAANKATAITGGVDGLQGIEMTPLFGRFGFDLYGRTGYWYALVVLFVCFWIARRLIHSPFGLSLRGIKQNAFRMPALGAPIHRRLVAIYTVAAVYAGIAGALIAQTTQFVSLDVLSFARSAELLPMLILGGAGHLYGALVGTVAFSIARYFLADLNPEYWEFWLGALLIVVVLFARDGMYGLWLRLKAKVAR